MRNGVPGSEIAAAAMILFAPGEERLAPRLTGRNGPRAALKDGYNSSSRDKRRSSPKLVTSEMRQNSVAVMPEVIVRPRENGSMRIDLDSGEIARIVKALEHHHAYLQAQRRDDNRYLRLADPR